MGVKIKKRGTKWTDWAGLPGSENLTAKIRGYLDRAAPLMSEGSDKSRQSFLLLPASN